MAGEIDQQELIKKFLSDLAERGAPSEDDPLPFVGAANKVWYKEIEGQILGVCKTYLTKCNCPDHLLYHITGEVLSRHRKNLPVELQKGEIPADEGKNSPAEPYNFVDGQSLTRVLLKTIHEVCNDWNRETPHFSSPEAKVTVSVHSIKNTRRKMEDRHIVCTDWNALFQVKDAPDQSFYGVFDGHSGVEAADYASVNVICNLARNPHLSSDVQKAMREAFMDTDDRFCLKSRAERWKSGTTGVCAFVRNNELTIAWVGDSQVMLVRKGNPVPLMYPHKPDRPDEKERIEEVGSAVLWIGGVWRVDGVLAVARAIGDAEYKPAVTGEPDVLSLELDGTEDFLVLGCDGVWDVLEGETLAEILQTHVKSGGDKGILAKVIVDYCKGHGSQDNITVIVVCFKRSPSRQSSGSQPTTPEHKPAPLTRQKDLESTPISSVASSEQSTD